jgi:hypothetical protein
MPVQQPAVEFEGHPRGRCQVVAVPLGARQLVEVAGHVVTAALGLEPRHRTTVTFGGSSTPGIKLSKRFRESIDAIRNLVSKTDAMADGSTGTGSCTWACAPQSTDPVDLPPSPVRAAGALADATLRQTIHVSLGGERIRLRLSNVFGRTALTITAVTVASPAGGVAGAAAIESRSAQAVTFEGRAAGGGPGRRRGGLRSGGAHVPAGSNLTVTMHLAQEPEGVTPTLVRAPRPTWMRSRSTIGTFLGGLEVWAPQSSYAVATLGDSLTDGRGSTTNGNDRWPDVLSARLRANPTPHTSPW